MRIPARLLVLFAVLIWGLSSPIAKFALDFFPPSTLLMYRFAIVTLILTPVILRHKRQHWPTKLTFSEFSVLAVLGLAGSVGQIGLIYWGMSFTTSIDSSLIISTSPLIITIASVLFMHESVSRRTKVGLAIGTIGSCLVVVSPLLKTGHLFTGSMLGNALVFLANISWAVYILLSKKLIVHRYTPLFLTYNLFGVGFVSMTIISSLRFSLPASISTIVHAPPAAHMAVLYVAACAGVIAYCCYQTAIKTLSAAQAEIFNYLTPAFAAPLAFLWLGEPITPQLIVSTAIIAVGVTIAETG